MIPALPVIFLWPFVVLVLFARLTTVQAICWSVIAGYLFLPPRTSLNLPVLPTIDKHSMPIFAVCIALLIYSQRHAIQNPGKVLPGILPQQRLMLVLSVMMLTAGLITAFTNSDPLRFEFQTIPGLRIYDGLSVVLQSIVTLLPLLVARKYLSTEDSHRTLLFVLCMSGLVYSFLVLFEVRMSPQLNIWVYGFFPHSWAQHVRGDGFRPVVFLSHGLWLGIFLCCTVLAAMGHARVKTGAGKALYIGIAVWLFVTLLLAKSLGALMIVLLLAPAVLLLGVRLQLIVAACIAGTVLLYPMLRGADVLPINHVVSLAERVSPNRAASLQYRLDNESILLEKANQRPAFGWGPWARARVYDERGRDISTTDGIWVITIGERGWFGYVARFGLLCLPIILMAFMYRRYEVGIATSALALVLAGNLIDLLPNAGLTPVTFLIAGALLGRLEMRSGVPQSEDTEPIPVKHRATPSYSRTFPVTDRKKPVESGRAQRYSRSHRSPSP